MGEVQRIVDQLQRAWDGEAFHGPAVRLQHSLYHAGQIALLKKAAEDGVR